MQINQINQSVNKINNLSANRSFGGLQAVCTDEFSLNSSDSLTALYLKFYNDAKSCMGRDFDKKTFDELSQKLKQIDDDEIKNYIAGMLKSNSFTEKSQYRKLAEEVDLLADAINGFQGKYSALYLKSKYRYSYISELSRFLRQKGMDITKMTTDLLKSLGSDANIYTFNDDLDKEPKLYGIKEFIKKYPQNPSSQYLYELYLKSCIESGEYDDETIQLCNEIYEQFGTRVFLSSILSWDQKEIEDDPEEGYIMTEINQHRVKEVLQELKTELAKWRKAGSGKEIMPPVIDYSVIKKNWYDDKQRSAGFCEAYTSRSISIKEISIPSFDRVTRHELLHSNQNNFLADLPTNKILLKTLRPFITKELKNAGISDSEIEYAFKDPGECIAVSAEGNISAYSDKYKNFLMLMGMPKWVFDLEPPL